MKQKQTIHKMPVYESDILIQEIHPFVKKKDIIYIYYYFFGFFII